MWDDVTVYNVVGPILFIVMVAGAVLFHWVSSKRPDRKKRSR